ncbi:hypothetical protein D3C87_1531640 [compost metagenome]
MRHAGLVCRVTLVIGNRANAENIAEAAELAVIADREDQETISRRHHLIGGNIRMGVAEPDGGIAGNQVIHILVGEHGRLHVQKRHVDMLAFT